MARSKDPSSETIAQRAALLARVESVLEPFARVPVRERLWKETSLEVAGAWLGQARDALVGLLARPADASLVTSQSEALRPALAAHLSASLTITEREVHEYAETAANALALAWIEALSEALEHAPAVALGQDLLPIDGLDETIWNESFLGLPLQPEDGRSVLREAWKAWSSRGEQIELPMELRVGAGPHGAPTAWRANASAADLTLAEESRSGTRWKGPSIAENNREKKNSG